MKAAKQGTSVQAPLTVIIIIIMCRKIPAQMFCAGAYYCILHQPGKQSLCEMS